MAQPKKEKEKSERGDKEDSGEVFPEDGKHSVTSSIPAATSLGAEAAGKRAQRPATGTQPEWAVFRVPGACFQQL